MTALYPSQGDHIASPNSAAPSGNLRRAAQVIPTERVGTGATPPPLPTPSPLPDPSAEGQVFRSFSQLTATGVADKSTPFASVTGMSPTCSSGLKPFQQSALNTGYVSIANPFSNLSDLEDARTSLLSGPGFQLQSQTRMTAPPGTSSNPVNSYMGLDTGPDATGHDNSFSISSMANGKDSPTTPLTASVDGQILHPTAQETRLPNGNGITYNNVPKGATLQLAGPPPYPGAPTTEQIKPGQGLEITVPNGGGNGNGQSTTLLFGQGAHGIGWQVAGSGLFGGNLLGEGEPQDAQGNCPNPHPH